MWGMLNDAVHRCIALTTCGSPGSQRLLLAKGSGLELRGVERIKGEGEEVHKGGGSEGELEKPSRQVLQLLG